MGKDSFQYVLLKVVGEWGGGGSQPVIILIVKRSHNWVPYL